MSCLETEILETETLSPSPPHSALLGIGRLVRDEERQHEVVGRHLGPAALPQPEGGVLVAGVEAEWS